MLRDGERIFMPSTRLATDRQCSSVSGVRVSSLQRYLVHTLHEPQAMCMPGTLAGASCAWTDSKNKEEHKERRTMKVETKCN